MAEVDARDAPEPQILEQEPQTFSFFTLGRAELTTVSAGCEGERRRGKGAGRGSFSMYRQRAKAGKHTDRRVRLPDVTIPGSDNADTVRDLKFSFFSECIPEGGLGR